MIKVYGQIISHCKYFSDTTFPASVGLASDIVHYNLKVPIYYGAFLPIIEAWNNRTMGQDQAKAKLDAILKNLRASALHYQDSATTVKGEIHKFVEEIKADKGNLEPLERRYKEKFEGESGLIKTYMEQIKRATDKFQSSDRL